MGHLEGPQGSGCQQHCVLSVTVLLTALAGAGRPHTLGLGLPHRSRASISQLRSGHETQATAPAGTWDCPAPSRPAQETPTPAHQGLLPTRPCHLCSQRHPCLGLPWGVTTTGPIPEPAWVNRPPPPSHPARLLHPHVPGDPSRVLALSSATCRWRPGLTLLSRRISPPSHLQIPGLCLQNPCHPPHSSLAQCPALCPLPWSILQSATTRGRP